MTILEIDSSLKLIMHDLVGNIAFDPTDPFETDLADMRPTFSIASIDMTTSDVCTNSISKDTDEGVKGSVNAIMPSFCAAPPALTVRRPSDVLSSSFPHSSSCSASVASSSSSSSASSMPIPHAARSLQAATLIMDEYEPTPIQPDRITVVPKVEPSDLRENSEHELLDLLRPLMSKRKLHSITSPEPFRCPSSDSVMQSQPILETQFQTDSLSTMLASKFRAQPKAKRRRIQFPVDARKRAMECKQPDKIKFHQEAQWEIRYKELCAFRQQEGHCSVPHSHDENQALAQWVKRQRYQFKLKLEGRHTTLTNRRQQALEDIGFCWDSHHALWELRFQELIKYKEVNGHCIIPARDQQNPSLAIWVKCQRRQFKLLKQGKRTNITMDRVDRLNAVGFVWDPRSGVF